MEEINLNIIFAKAYIEVWKERYYEGSCSPKEFRKAMERGMQKS